MTQTASASFETQTVDKPAGVGDLGGYLVSLMQAGVVIGLAVSVADKTVPVSFPIPAAGDYTVQVQRVDVSGVAVLAPASSAPFTVAPEQIEIPLSVTVIVA